MTTPERLRRRQRREEIMLIILGIIVGVVSVYFHRVDVDQRECITQNFAQLTTALTTRGDIAMRESAAAKLEGEATRAESRANDEFYDAVFSATTPDQAQAAFHAQQQHLEAVNQMRAEVDRMRAQIAKDRSENPIPDFPAGTCA